MPDESSMGLAVFFFAGLGMLLTGIANVLLRSKAPGYRAAASLLCLGIAGAGVWCFTESNTDVGRTLLFLGCLVVLCAVTGSDRLATGIAKFLGALRQPIARWGVVGMAGVALAAGAVTYLDSRANAEFDRQAVELELLTAPTSVAPASGVFIFTDQGNPVSINEATVLPDEAKLSVIENAMLKNPALRNGVIRQYPATNRSNCHGWVFTGGRYWILGESIDRILIENMYAPITDPTPGDLIVYRAGNSVAHTGLVRYVTKGHPVLVEGKWGCTGVYLHEADKSIYGVDYSFYRSPRLGHLLAGVAPAPPSSDYPLQPKTVVPNPDNPDEFTE
jgi:hypothetical protein